MSFLHPWALLLAGLAAVPLLLHLRRRRSRRRVAFPALRYLRRARESRARSLRVGDLLLLALRVALILVLAVLAAGPLVGRGGTTDHEPTDLALVVDNSASTGRLAGEETVLALLRRRATLAPSAARPGDRFWIFPTVGPPLAAGVGAGPARQALDRLEATDGRGTSVVALAARAAAALPSAEGRHREVHLLTDGQASAFGEGGTAPSGADSARGPLPFPPPGARAGALDPERSGVAPPALVVYRPPSLRAENGAVLAAEVSGGSRVPTGVEQTVAARTRRWGASPDSLPRASLRLLVDGRTVGGALARWGETAVFRLPELGIGPHRGRVEIEPDGLRADDALPFAVVVFPPPAVDRVGPPGSFLALALETLREGGRIAEPEDAAGSGGPRLRVVEGAASREAGASVPGPRPGAAVVLVPPADPVDLAAFRQLLARLGLPWDPVADDAAGDLSLLDDAGVPGLDSVRIHRRYRLRRSAPAGGGDTVLLRTRDGEPWLARGRAGGATYLLLASPLVPEASTLPTSPAMIPFTEALLLRWPGGGGWPDGVLPAGAPVSLPPAADSVRVPDGRTLPVEGGAAFTPLRAGIHLLYGAGGQGGEAAGASPAPPGEEGSADRDAALPFAVRVPAAESDLAPLAEARVQELFAGREVDIAGPAAPAWEDAIFRARRGADVGGWLVVLAVLIAAAEAAVATPGRAARGEAGRETSGTRPPTGALR